jgi:hypothetical protein
MANNIKEQLQDYNQGIQEFMKCVKSLPEHLFLKKIDDWTPRDVAAHFIGWNYSTIEGCRQMKKGETPAYLIDPGDDFCKVNAVLVREYDSRDKNKLISQLRTSADEFNKYLLALDSADWENDFGITWKGQTITIKNTIDALISDFINHRQKIEKWAEEDEYDIK